MRRGGEHGVSKDLHCFSFAATVPFASVPDAISRGALFPRFPNAPWPITWNPHTGTIPRRPFPSYKYLAFLCSLPLAYPGGARPEARWGCLGGFAFVSSQPKDLQYLHDPASIGTASLQQ